MSKDIIARLEDLSPASLREGEASLETDGRTRMLTEADAPEGRLVVRHDRPRASVERGRA